MLWTAKLFSSSSWPQIRGALIALALGVHACAATPTPRPVKPEDARTATAQEEIRLWLDALEDVGIHSSADELLSLVNDVGEACTTFKKTIMAPFQPILRLTGTGQSWALFAYPDRYPNRLVVDVRDPSGRWSPVFEGGNPELAFLAPKLTFRRIRGVYDTAAARGSPGKVYDRFADWVARETLAAFPNATDVRVKMVQFHVEVPYEQRGGADADEGKKGASDNDEKTRLIRLRSREQVERAVKP